MDWYMTILRTVHVLAAIVWLGGTAFMVLFLQPALRTVTPEVQRPAMLAIGPRAVVGLKTSAAIVLITGILMVLHVLGTGELDRLFNTKWGVSIFLGFLSAVAMFAVGFTFVMRNILRMKAMAVAGAPPSPEQATRMGKQMRYGAMVALLFGILAVAAMLIARGYN